MKLSQNRPFSKLMAVVLSAALMLSGTTVFAAEGGTVLGASGAVLAPFALPVGMSGDSPANPADTEQKLIDAIAAAGTDPTTIYVSDITLTDEISIPDGKNLTIDGNGHTITQQAAWADACHFRIGTGTNPTTVTIENLTLVGAGANGGIVNQTGGDSTLNDVTIQNCGNFGGIFNGNQATLTMNGGAIQNCTAGSYSGGGGIRNAVGSVTLTGVTIENCTTTSDGGGIFNNGTLTINGGVTIENCTADSNGGGIYNYSYGTVTVESGGVLTLAGNTAAAGDDIYIFGGTFTNSGAIYVIGAGTIYGIINGNQPVTLVEIPDAGLRAALAASGINPVQGTLYNPAHLRSLTSLDASRMVISDATGIEYMTNLTRLNIGGNKLTELDVSPLTKLEYLVCEGNQLTALDVSGNTALEVLDCSNTGVTSLDVSALISLVALYCSDNQLTALDVSGLTKLEHLICYNNQLTALDVSALVKLEYLNCYNNQLTALDVSGLQNLISLSCNDNQLTALVVSGLTKLERLICNNNQLTALDVSGLTKLERLICYNNQLTALDVSALVKLEYLNCYNNQLTALNVSGLKNLIVLGCDGNRLTALDVSALTKLETLSCGGNRLTTLDVSNTALFEFSASNTDITTLNVTGLNNLQYLNLLNTLIPSEADIIGLNKSLTTDFYYSYRGGGSASHTITATAGPGGSISPSGNVSVAHGGMQGFDFTPDSGYRILQVFVDGVDIPAFAQSGMTAFYDVTEDHTIHVTFAPIGAAVHTITATAGAGGSISPSGSVLVPEGGSQSFTVTPDSGYKISGVTVDGVSHGAIGSYTFTNVTGGHAIHAAFTVTSSGNISDSGGSGGSDGGSSGGGSATATSTATTWLEQNTAGSLADGAKGRNQDHARTRSTGAYGVRASALKSLAGLRFEHDTVADGVVQVRLTIGNPEKITKDIMVSGYVKGGEVDRIRSHFEKWFQNKLRVIHMDQSEPWGQPVQVAARVDLTGMDTNNLYFYSYEKSTNTYRRIEKPAYWIDKNGYLRFTTELAGDIIISEGPLERK